ncbi:ABC transporter substrate-binding protein [Chromobacterium sp. ATCC 53434]|uniref:ABC transporter substrate-binding protein n=1 Tax=Chromobacterium sp. (strain ATCC 53434 / SC 14030) TaxID=2059672 RepID=UPI0013051211|nr:ABC transporter substrate-binding protein [Chromobacterium sp. ATCC 53434]
MKILKILVLIFMIITTSSQAATLSRVRVSIEVGILENYKKWIDTAGGDCTKIETYKSIYATRAAVEMILLCQALRTGGYHGPIELVAMPNYSREVREAEQGHVDMPSESLWSIDIQPNEFYVTPPVIKQGDFEKGLYTATGKNITVKHLSDLKKYTAAMSSLWVVDWKTLKGMDLTVENVSTEDGIFDMVTSGRADFTILEFTTLPGMQQSFRGKTLFPVPGVKISLDGERSFVVSKQSPHGKMVFLVFSAGLKEMVKSGTIHRAWVESGFFNQNVESWIDLRQCCK